MASHRARQKSPTAKKSWPSGTNHDYRSPGSSSSADAPCIQTKYSERYISLPQFSQESSGITPVPTRYHHRDSGIHQKGYQSLSGFGIMDTECYFDLPSVAISDPQHSSTDISQMHMRRQECIQRLYRGKSTMATSSHSRPNQATTVHTQHQCEVQSENVLPRSVHRKLTQILRAKIATEGTYTEEGFVRLFTSLYFSNAALNKHALVAYIEEMAEAFAVNDPLRIIREKNLAHGLDIFGKNIADASIPLLRDMSNDSISTAADKVLLQTLKRVSNNLQILPSNSQEVPVSLPILPNIQSSGLKSTLPSHKNFNQQRHTSQSISTRHGLNTDSTLKASTLATTIHLPLMQPNKQQEQQQQLAQAPTTTLQEQFQKILEQQALQQAQQQAQIQLLQQQLYIQQELQQQQLLEHQISNERAMNQDYINYLHNHKQVEPFPRYSRIPTTSISVPRSSTVATSHSTGSIGVFKMPIRKRQVGHDNQITSRLNISPDRAHINTRQQQLLYECRSRAQELASILLSNKVTSSQVASDLMQIDWNQFAYSKELEPNQIYNASEMLQQQMDTQTNTQNNITLTQEQIPVVVVEEFDKAVQNTIQEELPDTPVLLSKCKPRRVGTPLLYREGITTILSHDEDDTDLNTIQNLKSREQSRLGKRYVASDFNYQQHSADVDIDLEVDSVALDNIPTTDNSSTNHPCVEK